MYIYTSGDVDFWVLSSIGSKISELSLEGGWQMSETSIASPGVGVVPGALGVSDFLFPIPGVPIPYHVC